MQRYREQIWLAKRQMASTRASGAQRRHYIGYAWLRLLTRSIVNIIEAPSCELSCVASLVALDCSTPPVYLPAFRRPRLAELVRVGSRFGRLTFLVQQLQSKPGGQRLSRVDPQAACCQTTSYTAQSWRLMQAFCHFPSRCGAPSETFITTSKGDCIRVAAIGQR